MKKKILTIFTVLSIVFLAGCNTFDKISTQKNTDKSVIKEKLPIFSPTCIFPTEEEEEVKDPSPLLSPTMSIPLPGSLLPEVKEEEEK